MTYFEQWSRSNDLSPSGRRRQQVYFRKVYLPLLPRRDVRILDFGCGAGLLLEWLKLEGYRAEGVDSNESQFEFSKTLGVKTSHAVDTVSWLRQAGQFDVIFMTDVLEHIPAEFCDSLLATIYAALNVDGTLIVRVPNANSTFGSRLCYIDPTHHRSYTEYSLSYDLSRAGFSAVRVLPDVGWLVRDSGEFVALCLRSVFHFLRRLEAISEFGVSEGRFPLSFVMVAVCRKTTLNEGQVPS